MRVNDQAILQRLVENYEKQIPEYFERLEDKIVSRVILPVRTVGDDVAIDVVEHIDRTGTGTQFIAKGTVPKGSGIEASEIPHILYQAMDGFMINEKDLSLDKQIKTRKLKVVLANMQRFENKVSINGDTDRTIPGIATLAAANPNGTITAQGTWDGSASARDIYDDLLGARGKMDGDYEPRFLIGERTDMNWLRALDSERKPFWHMVSSLFGKTPQDPMNSWAIEVGPKTLSPGFVYMATYDDEAAEFVISEDHKVRQIPQQRGGNYPIEVYSWYTIEGHDNKGFVQIKTSE